MANIPHQKRGLAITWPTDAMAGVECLRAFVLRHQYGRHCHDTYAIGVIEAGVGGNRCRGADHYTPAGSIVVMNPGEAHTGYSAGEGPLSYRMFYITPGAMRTTLPEGARAPYFEALRIDNAGWAARLQSLHRSLESSPDRMQKQAKFHTTIGQFCACFGKSSGQTHTGRETAAVRRIKAYLRAHYAEPVTIDSLAGLTELNRAYLIRVFTRAVGLPPYAYLTQLRIERAKALLSSGRLLADTALAVGFADQSHLNRQFKKLTGTTPRLYRLSHYRSRKSL